MRILWLVFLHIVVVREAPTVHGYVGAWLDPSTSASPPTFRRPADVLTDVINDLGVQILQEYAESGGSGNIAFSPTGIGFVLAVLYEGSAGPGKEQIARVLGLPRDKDVTRIGFRDIHRRLRSYLSPDGFLGGLTLNREKIKLRHEYEGVLKFFGFDIPFVEDGATLPNYSGSRPSGDCVQDTTESPLTSQAIPTEKSTTTLLTVTSDVGDEPSNTTPKTQQAAETSTIPTDLDTEVPAGTTSEPEETPTVTPTTRIISSFATTARVPATTVNFPTTTAAASLTSVADISTMTMESSSTTPVPESTTSFLSSADSTTRESVTDEPSVVEMKEPLEVTQENQSSQATTPIATSLPTLFTTTTLISSSEGTTIMPRDTGESFSSSSSSEEEGTASSVLVQESTTNQVDTTPMSDLETTTMVTDDPNSMSNRIQISTTSQSVTTNSPEKRTSRGTGIKDFVVRSVRDARSDLDESSAKINIDEIIRGVRSPTSYFSGFSNAPDFPSFSAYPDFAGLPDEAPWTRKFGEWRVHSPNIDESSRDSAQITFLVNGKEPTIVSAATYTVILPFAFLPTLQALALEFPLDDPRYNILLLLPTDREGTRRLVGDLGNVRLRELRKELQPAWVRAMIPSFMLKGFVTLTPFLQRLGIRDVFEPRDANLSPMTEEPGVYARDVQQSIGVNIRNYMKPDRTHSSEWNYQADISPPGHLPNPQTRLRAFRTRRLDAPPSWRNAHQSFHSGNGLFERAGPVSFVAEHPFLFFIVDADTGVSLIAGRIDDPLNSRIR
ncbi:uncharacterized protein LOC105693349 isoform X1 [Athalia rosae]|uniref:uncharacterized protein LOC105693349 isoform X1 n=1 Tax=Athalia rosae TaxID=37344 RepID=UPI002033D428|nr:uncharacterized protein LOC105693349 isoform X1 [Athalia rosae]